MSIKVTHKGYAFEGLFLFFLRQISFKGLALELNNFDMTNEHVFVVEAFLNRSQSYKRNLVSAND